MLLNKKLYRTLIPAIFIVTNFMMKVTFDMTTKFLTKFVDLF